MKNPPRKQPRAISFSVLQAELMRDLAREQTALVSETIRLIREIRELHAYAMEIGRSNAARGQTPKGKSVAFPAPSVAKRVQ